MDLKESKSTKNIKTLLKIIVIILAIEIIFAGILFVIKKKNNTNELINNSQDNQTKLISEIEKQAIDQKNIEKPKIPEEIDTDPRTRPLPQLNNNLPLSNSSETESVGDPRTRPLPSL